MLKDQNLKNDHEYIKNQKTKMKKECLKNITDRGDKGNDKYN